MRFRSLAICALLAALAWASPGCKHKAGRTASEEPGALAPGIRMGDPKSASQLVSGFHDIEAHAWRWSARKFSVLLATPKGAGQRGAVLTLNVTVMPELLRNGPVSLAAAINGNPLPPETWSKPGPYVFQRPVPAELLNAVAAKVDFELDQSIPPNDKDSRELGLVVARAALELK